MPSLKWTLSEDGAEVVLVRGRASGEFLITAEVWRSKKSGEWRLCVRAMDRVVDSAPLPPCPPGLPSDALLDAAEERLAVSFVVAPILCRLPDGPAQGHGR